MKAGLMAISTALIFAQGNPGKTSGILPKENTWRKSTRTEKRAIKRKK